MITRSSIGRATLVVALLGIAPPAWTQNQPAPLERSVARPAQTVREQRYFPSGEPTGSAVLLERVTPVEVRRGQDFWYEIRLTNLTRADIADLELIERMPDGFALRAFSPVPTRVQNRQAEWGIRILRAGETLVLQGSGATESASELTWCSELRFQTGICATTRVTDPKLVLTQSAPSDVVICDDIPIRLVVGNVGTGVARRVRVWDELPPGLTTTDGNTRLAFDAGDLAAGQSREFTFVTRASRLGEYRNGARAIEEGGATVDATATTRVRQPRLALTKSGPPMRYLGRAAQFDLTLTNPGDIAARDVVITDSLPHGATFLRAEPDGQRSGDAISWQVGSLEPGQSRTVRIWLNPVSAGVLSSTAVARGYCVEASAQAQLDVRGVPAVLLEVVDVADPIELGASETYEIRVTNQGTAPDTNIVISATLPPQMQLVSADGPTPGSVSGQKVTFAPLATLPPKAAQVYRVVAKGLSEGDVRFHVSLQTDQTETPVEETESTHIY